MAPHVESSLGPLRHAQLHRPPSAGSAVHEAGASASSVLHPSVTSEHALDHLFRCIELPRSDGNLLPGTCDAQQPSGLQLAPAVTVTSAPSQLVPSFRSEAPGPSTAQHYLLDDFSPFALGTLHEKLQDQVNRLEAQYRALNARALPSRARAPSGVVHQVRSFQATRCGYRWLLRGAEPAPEDIAVTCKRCRP